MILHVQVTSHQHFSSTFPVFTHDHQHFATVRFVVSRHGTYATVGKEFKVEKYGTEALEDIGAKGASTAAEVVAVIDLLGDPSSGSV